MCAMSKKTPAYVAGGTVQKNELAEALEELLPLNFESAFADLKDVLRCALLLAAAEL